jgi:hypothetical protein
LPNIGQPCQLLVLAGNSGSYDQLAASRLERFYFTGDLNIATT